MSSGPGALLHFILMMLMMMMIAMMVKTIMIALCFMVRVKWPKKIPGVTKKVNEILIKVYNLVVGVISIVF